MKRAFIMVLDSLGLARKTQTALATSAPIRWAILQKPAPKAKDHYRKPEFIETTRLGSVKA